MRTRTGQARSCRGPSGRFPRRPRTGRSTQEHDAEPAGRAPQTGWGPGWRSSVGATLLAGLPVADVHGGDPGQEAVLRAVVTGPERSFDQDPLLAFRLPRHLG
jgi:hypothetical protein